MVPVEKGDGHIYSDVMPALLFRAHLSNIHIEVPEKQRRLDCCLLLNPNSSTTVEGDCANACLCGFVPVVGRRVEASLSLPLCLSQPLRRGEAAQCIRWSPFLS